MKIQFISLFPDMFQGVMNSSMLWKAQEKGIISCEYINLREFGIGPRRQVDDIIYGGGDGMLLKPEPLVEAIEHAKEKVQNPLVILLTPRGKVFKQKTARELAGQKRDLIFVCARYEGYDERIVDYVDMQLSIGEYILTGGELPAMVVADAVIRLLPGVLGGEASAEVESFSDGQNLEFPQYTRPAEFRGKQVPEVLLSGNHAAIQVWRDEHSKAKQ